MKIEYTGWFIPHYVFDKVKIDLEIEWFLHNWLSLERSRQGSFYLSLNGAKNYASRDKEIMEMTKSDISGYTDSLTNNYSNLIFKNDSVYDSKISVLESNNGIKKDSCFNLCTIASASLVGI